MRTWNNEPGSVRGISKEIMARSYIRIRKEKSVRLGMEHVRKDLCILVDHKLKMNQECNGAVKMQSSKF